MDVAVNFFRLKKSYTDVQVYLVRIFPKGCDDPVAEDQRLDEHKRYQIVQSGENKLLVISLRYLFRHDPRSNDVNGVLCVIQ